MKHDAILTENICRSFKKKGGKGKRKKTEDALKNISFSVKQGEIFGFLGPNGAGKTTLIKIFTTLLYPTSGRAFVAGYDVIKETRKVRPLINMVSGGETSGFGILTVEENIWMFSQFYGIKSKVAKERARRYLKRFDLLPDARTKVNKLSTGMRQKMNIIRGLVTDPQVLFLDEPTLGLDVHTAREVRSTIEDWVGENPSKTVFLTTHYMAEADELCDRIAIIDKGKIIACDTPSQLRIAAGTEMTYKLRLKPEPRDLSFLKEIDFIRQPYFGPKDHQDGAGEVKFTMSRESALPDLLTAVKSKGFEVAGFSKEEISLEDLFIKIVGRELENGE